MTARQNSNSATSTFFEEMPDEVGDEEAVTATSSGTSIEGGQSVRDVNPAARAARPGGPTVKGLRGPNTDTADMHAEIGAMMQAKAAGVEGGHGVLTVEGKDLCSRCRGDVKTMARDLELDSLTIMNNGSLISFNMDDLRSSKQGGKRFTKKR